MCQESLFVIIRKDILSELQELLNHRVRLGNELDDSPRRQFHEPTHDPLQGNIVRDGKVMDQRKGNETVTGRALL
jgi:hypothetical protein